MPNLDVASVVFFTAPCMDSDSIIETTFQDIFSGFLNTCFNSPPEIFLLVYERIPLFNQSDSRAAPILIDVYFYASVVSPSVT